MPSFDGSIRSAIGSWIFTVTERGWSGIENGELLALAEAEVITPPLDCMTSSWV